VFSARRSTRLLVVAAAVACAAAAPAPAQAATNSCRAESLRSGSTILLATKDAVVFRSKRFKTETVCSYRYKRIVVIGGFACCQQVRYTLNGRYFGYALRLDQADNEVDELGAVDLRTGKRLTYTGTSSSTTVDTNGFVRAFYITPKGTLAWLQENAVDGDGTGALAVRAIAPRGATQELDTGNVGADSLALGSGGKILYWTKDGAARSAAL
jgi:hypothetical protein